ncbi:hypothetical protein RN001_008611 [Aquatica leii]|uniref:Single domain-containing protein n=1 Tax=Aquatica leii TaxID=1421715 RepID=A0AAN7P4H0_9COLE|nr:hypothetical protein RN001_008611 [Aquatica leii]
MSRALIYVFATCVCVIFSQHGEGPWYVCKENGIYFEKGQKITVPEKCETFTCVEPGINMMRNKRCDELEPTPGCILEDADTSKPFPDCCQTLKTGIWPLNRRAFSDDDFCDSFFNNNSTEKQNSNQYQIAQPDCSKDNSNEDKTEEVKEKVGVDLITGTKCIRNDGNDRKNEDKNDENEIQMMNENKSKIRIQDVRPLPRSLKKKTMQDLGMFVPQLHYSNYKLPRYNEYDVPIINQHQIIEPSGSYKWGFATANGIAAEEVAVISDNSKQTSKSVRGSYQYISPDGVPVIVTYTADENGFQPQVISSTVPEYGVLPDFYKMPIKQ